MATKKKLLQAAAGSAGGAGGLDIPDVFSTYLYTGNNQDGTVITNGIDLEGEGGLIWIKRRNAGTEHLWQDSARGAGTGTSYKQLFSNLTSAQNTTTNEGVTSFNSNGFTIDNGGDINQTGNPYVSWTWRKAPKFFDVVTYSGTGVAGLTVDHNLGSVPGMIIIKGYDDTRDWAVYHRGVDATNPEDYAMVLQKTVAREDNVAWFNDTAPTDTQFTVGNKLDINRSGYNYVAYLFAHNDGDGEFGPDGDADIIKCGSYTGNGSSDGPEIDLGFEPQWVMIKNASSAGPWVMLDNMRGWPVTDENTFTDHMLWANTNNAEYTTVKRANITSTGFHIRQTNSQVNTNNDNYIYMAIRRGPLAQPESGTEVFAIDTRGSTGDGNLPTFRSTFPVDLGLYASSSKEFITRLMGPNTLDANTNASQHNQTSRDTDYMNGFVSFTGTNDAQYGYMWKRAPGFFDVVAWNTENTANRRLDHNLTVTPEMVWVKSRDYTESWYVYHKDVGSNGFLSLNETDDNTVTSAMWPSPSATEFGIRENAVWNAGTAMIGYFFATVDGISKVGSFTGNGSSQTINCGFTAGSRFILIKRTDANGNWVVFDSLRGIVSGNSPYILLNDTQAENASYDIVDPDSSGFIINQETQNNLNVNGANYIFYAIA